MNRRSSIRAVSKKIGDEICVENDFVIIRRIGFNSQLEHRLSGERRIPLSAIRAVVFREGKRAAYRKAVWNRGFLRLEVEGEEAPRGGGQAARFDQNSVTFFWEERADFAAVRDHIEALLAARGPMAAEPIGRGLRSSAWLPPPPPLLPPPLPPQGQPQGLLSKHELELMDLLAQARRSGPPLLEVARRFNDRSWSALALMVWSSALQRVESGPDGARLGVEAYELITDMAKTIIEAEPELWLWLRSNPDVEFHIEKAWQDAGNGVHHLLLTESPDDEARHRYWFAGAAVALLRASDGFSVRGYEMYDHIRDVIRESVSSSSLPAMPHLPPPSLKDGAAKGSGERADAGPRSTASVPPAAGREHDRDGRSEPAASLTSAVPGSARDLLDRGESILISIGHDHQSVAGRPLQVGRELIIQSNVDDPAGRLRLAADMLLANSHDTSWATSDWTQAMVEMEAVTSFDKRRHPEDEDGSSSVRRRVEDLCAHMMMWSGIAESLVGDGAAAVDRLEAAAERFEGLAEELAVTTDLGVHMRLRGVSPGFTGMTSRNKAFLMAGRSLEEAGEAAVAMGHLDQARRLFDRSSDLYRRSDDPGRSDAARARARRPMDVPTLPSAFLRGTDETSSVTVLGSTTAVVLRRNAQAEARGHTSWPGTAAQVDEGIPPTLREDWERKYRETLADREMYVRRVTEGVASGLVSYADADHCIRRCVPELQEICAQLSPDFLRPPSEPRISSREEMLWMARRLADMPPIYDVTSAADALVVLVTLVGLSNTFADNGIYYAVLSAIGGSDSSDHCRSKCEASVWRARSAW